MSKSSAISSAVATLAKDADKTPAAPALSFDPAAVLAQATALAAADAAFENGLAAVAEGVARILGATPTYAHWVAVAEAFQADYAKARGCSEKTAVNRWHMLTSTLADKYALEKPAKPSAEAQRKAGERAKVADKVKAARAKHATVAQLQAAVAKEKDPAQAAVLALAMKEASAEATREAEKAARDAEKALREEARDILGKLHGKSLEKALAALRKLAPAIDASAAPM